MLSALAERMSACCVLDRKTGQKLWATRVVFGGDSGGFFGGAALDGRHLSSAPPHSATANSLTQTGLCDPAYRDPSNPNVVDTYIQDPSLHSLALKTGQILREQNDNESFGATTLADHVVFAGFIGLSEASPVTSSRPTALIGSRRGRLVEDDGRK